MNRSDLKQFLAKEYGLKPIQREPTLQDKVREALEKSLTTMVKRICSLPSSFIFDDFEGEVIPTVKEALGVKLYGMLKLQIVADVVNEAYPKVCNNYFWIIQPGEDGKLRYYGDYKSFPLGSILFNDVKGLEVAHELMNVKYFEGDITLEDMR